MVVENEWSLNLEQLMKRLLLICLVYCGCFVQAVAQSVDTNFMGMELTLDEFVVNAVHQGWDINAFIKRMREDTTFYKAFLGLRTITYTSDNEISFLDEYQNVYAHLENRTVQTMKGNCRNVVVAQEIVSGDYYDKKHEPRYYTAELFQNLFFRARQNECGMSDDIGQSHAVHNRLEKNKEQLKQLVFNPGTKVDGIPFVGKKASVFEAPSTQQLYDFKLSLVRYNGEECYFFQAIPKPEFRKEVVYQQLDTWFRLSDYAIVARDYALTYHTLLYDFDVYMKVRLEKVGQRLLPSSIDYRGNWHVFSKKRERARFNIQFDY